jgi:putative ABC transport system permease protein
MMLGTLVGVTALTLVVSIGAGAERKILKTIHQIFGTSSVLVYSGGGVFVGGPRVESARLTLDDVEALARELPAVEAWDPQQVARLSVRRGDRSTTARVLGGSERSERVWERSVSRGEYFDASAVAGTARVALLGETVARELFGTEDPVGAEVLIGPVSFQVLGILERFGTDAHGMDRDAEVVVPISTAMRRLLNVDTIRLARLVVKDPAQLAETSREVRRILRDRHALVAGQPDDFTVVTPLEVRKVAGRVQRVLNLYLPLVAAISLLAGGVAAGALMLAAVNERTSEIGLRRAVGARPRDIRRQFLLETAVTTLGGGAGGLLLGSLLAREVARRMSLGDVLSWKTVVLGLGLSAATGLLAGVWPARRAALLPPAVALR